MLATWHEDASPAQDAIRPDPWVTDDKENANPNTCATRSILKRQQPEALRTKKNSLFVKFAPVVDPVAEDKMTDEALVCLRSLALVWARQAIKSSDPPNSRYKNRLAVNFQPGMTPLYLKYLLETYSIKLEPLQDTSLTKEAQKIALQEFSTKFSERASNRIFIVDSSESEREVRKQLEENTSPAILIIQMPDMKIPTQIRSKFLLDHLTSKHSLIVFSESICGLHQSKIERIYNVKLRHVWLPRLQIATYHPDYTFLEDYIERCHGIPAIVEQYQSSQWSTESIEDSVRDMLALWTRPEFQPFLGYFYTLFSVARSGSQLYARNRLSAELSVFDAATILGFIVTPAGIKRKNSDDEKKQMIEVKHIQETGTPSKSSATKSVPAYLSERPYNVEALPSIANKFQTDRPDFDAFILLRGNTLKWFEAERGVARAIVESLKVRGDTLGDKWPFFRHSRFVANKSQVLSMRPQVIPKVKKIAPELDETTMKKWSESSRQYPPQKTMTSSSWPMLIRYLDPKRVIIPAEMSKSPDVLFLFSNTALVCFQVKTGAQDNTVSQLVEELAKCPYLLRPHPVQNKVVFSDKAPKTASVTFVYVAPVHKVLKAALLPEAVEVVEGKNEEEADNAAVTKHFEYIHLKHGCKVIDLPERVEVIVLLRAGLEALFGEDYRTLLDQLCEIESLEQEEIQRKQLRAKSEPLPTTTEEVEQEAHRIFAKIKHVPGAEEILIKKLKELYDSRHET